MPYTMSCLRIIYTLNLINSHFSFYFKLSIGHRASVAQTVTIWHKYLSWLKIILQYPVPMTIIVPFICIIVHNRTEYMLCNWDMLIMDWYYLRYRKTLSDLSAVTLNFFNIIEMFPKNSHCTVQPLRRGTSR